MNLLETQITDMCTTYVSAPMSHLAWEGAFGPFTNSVARKTSGAAIQTAARMPDKVIEKFLAASKRYLDL